jgi:hypothetical protein
MTKTQLSLIATVALWSSLAASAAIFNLDPDSFSNGTDLTHALPEVTLLTAVSSDNQTVVPSWYISAVGDSYASTGNNVFGYLSFHSLWDGRRLRMDFTSPISEVSIDFISSFNDAGELHVFDSNWRELGTGILTPALAAHQVQTMTLSSTDADIAHAVAYSHGTGFGRLDNLRFTTVIPEPSPGLLGAVGFISLILVSRMRERG